MGSKYSRLTTQGQISVPAGVRERLGVGPGSVLEWKERDGEFVVCRVGRYSSEDVHQALFGRGPPGKARSADVKAGIRQQMRRRHARR